MMQKNVESLLSRLALITVALLVASGSAAAQDEDPYTADEDPFADEDDPFAEGDESFANESSEDPFTEYEESATDAQQQLDADPAAGAVAARADEAAPEEKKAAGEGAKVPFPGALFAIGALGAAVAILGRKRA